MKWAVGGRYGNARMEEGHQPQGEHSQIFSVLYHTCKLLGNLSLVQLLFSLLFSSCLIHVLHGTGFVSSTAWYYPPCPRSGCERFGSPETAGIPEKMWHLLQGWACSLWGLRSRLLQAGWNLGWGRTGRVYMTSVLFQATCISSPYFLSPLSFSLWWFPRCIHLQLMLLRFWLCKETQEGLEFLLWTLSFWVLFSVQAFLNHK